MKKVLYSKRWSQHGNVRAITLQYDPAAAAVGAIQAGVDIILCPKDLIVAFEAVIDAVDNGTISEERINQSACRILRLKQRMGRLN